ncbi:hypothetical protein [Allobranchiibius sp. GilTou73]|uniref:hypothetical protein n=1 Tax=Allobranchiibius sp. GilTou73 TaxID=2904523 RepID=UPI001F30F7EA|nr:hypothetical protein [Allobranchiibius sp. GilTou73]UIJ35320.1 hypothetical protein LVQ62_02715 [Allobranchiibius sp. GilTou73]
MTTEDLSSLRADVVSALSLPPMDFLGELSASSLRAMFNRIAPAELRIGGSAVLRVRLGSRQPLSREISQVTDAFSAAVASIGHEIRRQATGQSESVRPINASDYRKTPVFVQASGGNLIVMRPDPPELLEPLAQNTPSTSERAISRLANLLPESRDLDEHLVVRNAVGAARADRYALDRIAKVARITGGVAVEWETSSERAEGFVSVGQANELVKVLSEVELTKEVIEVHGHLDGARVKRRAFWLERQNADDIDGVVDEDVMPAVLANLDSDVTARILRTISKTKSGKASRPSHRLIGLTRVTNLP